MILKIVFIKKCSLWVYFGNSKIKVSLNSWSKYNHNLFFGSPHPKHYFTEFLLNSFFDIHIRFIMCHCVIKLDEEFFRLASSNSIQKFYINQHIPIWGGEWRILGIFWDALKPLTFNLPACNRIQISFIFCYTGFKKPICIMLKKNICLIRLQPQPHFWKNIWMTNIIFPLI